MTDQVNQQASTEKKTSLAEDSQQVVDLVGAVITDFRHQWSARFTLAAKEWHLSKQSASMIIFLSLFLTAIMSTIWLLSNLALGLVLYNFGFSLLTLGLCLLCLNIVLLFILCRSIKTLFKNIGFSRCIDSLTDTPNN